MNYKWYLKDNYSGVEKNGLNVFGSFICGGGSTIDPKYLIGMSVPPLMTAGVAKEIAKQWFKK